MTVALLLPVTYGLDPTAAFIMFAGIFYGSMFGGSTTSILLNTPGELLGHHRHRGQPHGQAQAYSTGLATAAIGSFVAGLIQDDAARPARPHPSSTWPSRSARPTTSPS